MHQTKTSGLSITSLVLGIVGLLCVPFLGVVSLGFGVLGLRQVRRSEGAVTGGGLAITGIVLGSVNILLSALIVIFFVFVSVTGRPREPLAVMPTYDGLIGEELSGSGFHFEWEGQRYIGCSLHQFGGEIPGSMISMDHGEIPIIDRVHVQQDVQVLRYDEAVLEGVEPLAYSQEVRVRRGEVVLIMDFGKAHHGTVIYSFPDEDGLVYMRLDESGVSLQGMSGNAVVSGVTGTVVGVLINGIEDEGIVGFELLKLPDTLLDQHPSEP